MKTLIHEIQFGRIALFLIYGWFGMLKALEVSPASPLVITLLHEVAPWMNIPLFLILFAFFEIVIGTTFLVIGARTWVVRLFLAHMVMTIAPLFLLPEETWSGFLVPTIMGQYCIKNIALVALVRFLHVAERARDSVKAVAKNAS